MATENIEALARLQVRMKALAASGMTPQQVFDKTHEEFERLALEARETPHRKAAFELSDATVAGGSPLEHLEHTLSRPARNDEERALASAVDSALSVSSILKKIERTMRLFARRPYQPSARRVYQPAALP